MRKVRGAIAWAVGYVQYLRERGYLLEVGPLMLMTGRHFKAAQRSAFDLGRDLGPENASVEPRVKA